MPFEVYHTKFHNGTFYLVVSRHEALLLIFLSFLLHLSIVKGHQVDSSKIWDQKVQIVYLTKTSN